MTDSDRSGELDVYNDEYVEFCISLARFIAYQERRVAALQNLAAPATFVQIEQQSLDKALAELPDNLLAQALLEQARSIETIKDARQKFVAESTALGRFEAVAHAFASNNSAYNKGRRLTNKEEIEAWTWFCRCHRKGDVRGMLQQFMEVLRLVREDALLTDLPPQPPKFVIPRPSELGEPDSDAPAS